MHDWTFVSLLIDWIKGNVTLIFKDHRSEEVRWVGEKFVELRISRREEWGESFSVNQVNEPVKLNNGNYQLSIEIQSGDVIEIEAQSFFIPKSVVAR